MDVYVDILEELSRVVDIKFMTKRWKPVVANANGENLTLTRLRNIVLRSPRVQEVIRKLCADYNISNSDLQRTVAYYLDDMGHFRSITAIRWVGLGLCRILKKNYSGIIVNERSISNVKDVMGSNPVLFLPSHKSYADFILMSFLCFYYDIEIPVIAAGEDFQSMWVMGRVLRECCAFFIRRTFGDDDLYKATVTEYVSALITSGHSAMEFFVEGTRSRSGKSVAPKYGMMTMALEAYFQGRVPDITIVPISISYERVLEDNLFARELLGLPKPQESTALLLRALHFLKDNYGRIFVEFAPPISVKELCQSGFGTDPRIDLNVISRFQQPNYPTAQISQFVENLCYYVIKAQNEHCTFSSIHLLCASISVWSSFDSKIPFQKLIKDMKYLLEILKELQSITIVKDSLEEEVMQCIKLHHRTMYFDTIEDSVKLHVGMARGSSLNDPFWKIKFVSESTFDAAYPAMVIQQYANPVCLKCIHLCIVTLVMCTTTEEITQEELFSRYQFLRKMLSTEFVLQDMPTSSLTDFNKAVSHLTALNILGTTMNGLKLRTDDSVTDNKDRIALLVGLIHPFIRGYYLALDTCIQEGELKKWVPHKFLRMKIQNYMESNIGRGVPRYILSVDLISNAVSFFVRMGIITKRIEGNLCMLYPDISECEIYRETIKTILEGLWTILNDAQETFSTECKITYSKL